MSEGANDGAESIGSAKKCLLKKVRPCDNKD